MTRNNLECFQILRTLDTVCMRILNLPGITLFTVIYVIATCHTNRVFSCVTIRKFMSHMMASIKQGCCITFYIVMYVTSVRGQTNMNSTIVNQCTQCADSCITDGICTGGCNQGYHGARCIRKCPDLCKNCTDSSPESFKANCTYCDDGYFSTNDLFQCQTPCPDGCKTCISFTSSVANCKSCKTGYYIDSTSEDLGNCRKCPTDCSNCSSVNKCLECSLGFYGKLCEKVCSLGCVSALCEKEQGACIYGCNSGFQTNDHCDKCIAGKYGTFCKKDCPIHCSDNICDKGSGDCLSCDTNFQGPKCNSCKDGLHGQNCNLSCPSTCNGSICFQYTGLCDSCEASYAGSSCDNCVTGKFGEKCDDDCPENCKDNKCDRSTGNCFLCSKGYKGEKCDICEDGYFRISANITYFCKPCRSNCLICSSVNVCSLCKAGFFGESCNLNCSIGCLNQTCEIMSGNCLYECKQGFTGTFCNNCIDSKYGPDCDRDCPERCQNKCNRDTGDCDSCIDMFHGLKCDECIVGIFGDSCNKTCNAYCNNSECDRYTGICSNGCKNYFTGDFCNECEIGYFGSLCSYNCPSGCSGGICNQETGFCKSCIENFIGNKCEKCVSGYFGPQCTDNCSKGCLNYTCAQDSGVCSNGCDGEFSGDKCCMNNSYCAECDDTDTCSLCVNGRYGDQCENICQKICDGFTCNKTDGKCNVLATFTEDISIIIGGIIGGILGILLVFVIILLLFRRRKYGRFFGDTLCRIIGHWIYENSSMLGTIIKSPFKRSKDDRIQTQDNQSFQDTIDAPERIELSSIGNTVNSDRPEVTSHSILVPDDKPTGITVEGSDPVYMMTLRRISVTNLAKYVGGKSMEFFSAEFLQLPKGLQKPCNEAKKPENIFKNRYNSVYPYDDTRVVLAAPGSDFINACYINGYRRQREYIASLGPIAKATENFCTFWRMVWQEKTEKIVMVTNLNERGGMKCEQYWPAFGTTLSYDDVTVTCHSEDYYAEYAVRLFTVYKDNERRNLHHLHFTAWPDKGVPDDVTSLVEFRQKVNNIKTPLNGCTIVHCSAGVGRTGTYIALDILTKKGETEHALNIYDCVFELRQQRTSMVQTAVQYEYLHHALVHSLTYGCEPISAEEFLEYFETCSDNLMKSKFEQLKSSTHKLSKDEEDAIRRNRDVKEANRIGADIPGDRHRVRLYLDRSRAESDYINAIYFNSFKSKDKFIVAQTPMAETVSDFLTMVMQENVSCIVSMDSLQLLPPYLPPDGQIHAFRMFDVDGVLVETNESYIHRSLTIQLHARSGTQTRTVQHFQCRHWCDETLVPESAGLFLHLVQATERADYDVGGGHIVVHCLNAAERSGLFCAVAMVIQKMEIEHEISVVNSIRQIRVRRPLAIPNKEQYVFVHQCICQYLQSYERNEYSNFALQPVKAAMNYAP